MEEKMGHLNFVDRLQLEVQHALSMVLVRTGVPGQESYHRLFVVSVMDDRALVFHHRGSLTTDAPQLAFFVGSDMGDGVVRANWLEAGYSFRLQLVDQAITSSRVIPGGICVLPEWATSERVMHQLMQVGPHLIAEFRTLEVDYPELEGMSSGDRESVRSALAILPEDQRQSAASMLARVYQTGDRSSFFGALSSFNALGRLYQHV